MKQPGLSLNSYQTMEIFVKPSMTLIFISLVSLLSLTSCGEGGSQTKLEISKGFLAANTGFDGGIIIVGRKDQSQESFSIDLTAGTEASITLTKGSWTFSAVGWDGGNAAPFKLFAGTPYCKHQQVNLINDQEKIELLVTKEACNVPEFTAGNVDTLATPHTFKKLSLFTSCNTFFSNDVLANNSPSAHVVQSSTVESYCDNLAQDQKTKVKSLKIYASKKNGLLQAATLGMSSECIQASAPNSSLINPHQSGQPYNGRDLRLPLGTIPLVLVTYEDDACEEPLARYPFEKGLAGNYVDSFDHRLLNRTSPYTNELRLVLPGNDMKRGLSPFMALLPYVKCKYGSIENCYNLPTGLTSTDYHGFPGSNNHIRIENTSCVGLTSDGTTITAPSCTPQGDDVDITFTAAVGSGFIDLNGKTYYVKVSADSTEDYRRYEVQSKIIELMGQSNTTVKKTFYQYGGNGDDDKAYGALGRVRDMFSANAVGGVFRIPDMNQSFEANCNALSGSKEVQIYNEEKMSLETYKVAVHDTVSSTPGNFYCNIEDLDEASCPVDSNFDKRLLIYDYKQSAITPSIVMEINCAKFIGKMETNEIDIEETEKDEMKEIIQWNTEKGVAADVANQRYEILKWNKQYKLASNVWQHYSEQRQMARVLKTNGTDYQVIDYSYNGYLSGSDWKQHIASYRVEVQTASTWAYYAVTRPSDFINSTPLQIFSVYPTEAAEALTASSTDKFQLNVSWGSQTVSPNVTSFSTFVGQTEIFGKAIRLNTLNSTDFTNSFGGTFFTAP